MKRSATNPMRAVNWMCTALAAAAGCGDDAQSISFKAHPPVQLDGALAYLETETRSLIVVDPSRGVGTSGKRHVARYDAGEGPVRIVSAPVPGEPAQHQVLVTDPASGRVLVFRDKRGTVDALNVGVALDAVDVREDGRYAVAYQPEGVLPSESIFALKSTVAVLELSRAAPRVRTLQLGPSALEPRKAVFAQSCRLQAERTVAGEPHTAVLDAAVSLIFVAGGVVPVDLDSGRAGTLVPLTADRNRAVAPEEVLFTNNRGDRVRGSYDNVERAFVRTKQGELFVLAISIGPSEDLLVALENVVTPEVTVRDVELFFGAQGNALLLAVAGHELILVDGFTGVATRFDTDVFVDKLRRYEDPESSEPLALGYGGSSPSRAMLRLDPLALERRRSSAVEVLTLGDRLRRVDVAAGAAHALLRYDDQRQLGLLDLRRGGDMAPMTFAYAPSALALDRAGERLRVVVRHPVDGEPYLTELTLAPELAERRVRLDQGGRAVGETGGYLWVDHGDVDGAVTFFHADALDRGAAKAFRGLFYTGLLAMDPDPAARRVRSGGEVSR